MQQLPIHFMVFLVFSLQITHNLLISFLVHSQTEEQLVSYMYSIPRHYNFAISKSYLMQLFSKILFIKIFLAFLSRLNILNYYNCLYMFYLYPNLCEWTFMKVHGQRIYSDKLIKYFHSVMSNSWSSCEGKSSVFITIDFPCSPALKAMLFTSLNLLSIMPGTPSKAAKGGTAPGSTPNFLTSSQLHMRLFLANSSTFLNLFQLIFRSARYSNRQIESLPFTNMVFEPHSSGVFLSSADSLQVLVAACSITSNLMQLTVRQLTILLYTCESQMWGRGITSYYFYINKRRIKFNTKQQRQKGHQEFSLKSMRLGYDQLKERLVVDLELFLNDDDISLKVG